MAALRRQTSAILTTILVACLASGLVGAVRMIWRQPGTSLKVIAAMILLAGAVTHLLGERRATLAILSVVFSDLGLGLCALHLCCGISLDAVLWIAAAIIVLVMLVLVRALIAAGSADDPYRD